MIPLISVIMPVYNGKKFLKDAVESILNQTLENFEFIIINDASEDGSDEILASYNDSRIKIVNNTRNLGVVSCLNLGMGIAKGEFIARIDADDIAIVNRFERQISYFNAHPEVDICGSYVDVFGDLTFPLRAYEHHHDIKAGLLFLNIITHPSVMFKREPFVRNGLLYSKQFRNAEDYGLWIDAMDTMKFATVPEVLLKYRIHGQNVSVKKDNNWPELKEMNSLAYRKIFAKMNLEVSSQELEIHLNLGFLRTEHLSKFKYSDYLRWLKKLIKCNNQNCYFNNKSLRNQILHKVIYLTKNMHIETRDRFFLIKTMISVYSTFDYINFFLYRSRYLKTLGNQSKNL